MKVEQSDSRASYERGIQMKIQDFCIFLGEKEKSVENINKFFLAFRFVNWRNIIHFQHSKSSNKHLTQNWHKILHYIIIILCFFFSDPQRHSVNLSVKEGHLIQTSVVIIGQIPPQKPSIPTRTRTLYSKEVSSGHLQSKYCRSKDSV